MRIQPFKLVVLIPLVLYVLVSQSVQAKEAVELDLPIWIEGAPGKLGNEANDIPIAMVRIPASEGPMAAIVVCPGGGYGGLAMGHEGIEIAKWANDLGMAAIICDYRHRGKGYGHPAPLDDLQRTMRLVRTHASQWNIDPNRVGVMGFSAGGHLASSGLTKFDRGHAESKDPVERESCRPDFGILAYPVILFGQPATHRGSQVNLLGESPSEALVQSFQNAAQVTADTPPTFLFHTYEDKAVLPENAVQFYLAMIQHGVAGELHVYEKGRHGVGLGRDVPGTSDWSNTCERWLTNRSVLSR
jgi:acetyl esterase/lipase